MTLGHSTLPRSGEPYIIEPSWILAWNDGDFALLRDHCVVVADSRIAEIRPSGIVSRDWRLRCQGQLLVPGFIAGHAHTTIAAALRGVVGLPNHSGNPLQLADRLGDQDRYDLTLYRLSESLRSGCTTRFEQALSLKQAKAHLAAAVELRSREYLSAMTPGWDRVFPIWHRSKDEVLFDSEPDTLTEIAAIREWSLENNNRENGRIRMQMGPHAPNTHTPATMRAVAAAARELGNGIQIHLSQDAREVDDIRRLWRMSPARWIEQFGFFDGPVIVAHLRAADLVDEVPFLASHGVTFGYCPWEGGIAGTTMARIWPEALAAGMNTSIGTEFSNDYVEAIKLAVFYGGARFALRPYPAISPVPLKNPTIWDALRAATVNGASITRRDDLGRIQLGAKADLASIDVTGYFVGSSAVPPQPVYNLLYASGLSVVHTITDGQIQMHDRRLVVADETGINDRAARVMELLWREAANDGWFDDRVV